MVEPTHQTDETPGDVRALDREHNSPDQRPAKRTRVVIACQRCKTRKQKCEGVKPCASCKALGINCEFIIPQKPTQIERKHYVKALEDRVAHLETLLAGQGLTDLGQDHLQYGQQSPSPPMATGNEEYMAVRAHDNHRMNADHPSDNQGEEVDSMIGVLRDLSLEATGGYIGASASISMGRLVSSIVKGREQSGVSRGNNADGNLGPKSLFRADDSNLINASREGPMLVSAGVADRLLVGYMKHISTRFPILHTPQLRKWHARRDSLQNTYEKSTLHLAYAIGGRFLETTGEACPFFPEMHYDAALTHLDEILQFHDIRSIITLLLLAIYCLRAPGGPGAWTYIGLAMRICIDLGLHRRTRKERLDVETEMRKRIFWTCYFLDRQVSIVLGRPFAISDHDIDLPLPLEVDEASDSIAEFHAAAASTPASAPPTSTTLSSFLHVLRLRRIESNIQHRIYRVDRESSHSVSTSEIDFFLEQLHRWKSMIPLDTHKKVDSEATSFDGYDYYMVFYYKCLRLLLFPQLSVPNVEVSYLRQCAEACGGVCETYKRLHHSMSVGFSLMALQTVFLAGLTLIYCIWISPEDIYNITTSNNLNSCSIVLYIITERWPGARKYRDAFEGIKHTVIELVAKGEHRPRKAIAEVGARSKMLNVNPEEEGGDEFWRMVGDMAGDDQQFSEDADLISSNSMNTFISDPDFLMDAQLAMGNMDTAIGFDMDGLLSNPELFGESMI